jgi:hypothetical protein
MRKNMKLNSDGGCSGSENADEAVVAPMVGSGVRRSVLNVASVAEKVFSHSVYLKK